MVEKLKELDKKILKGLGITIAFLIIWLVTLSHVSYRESPFGSYAGLNESERYIQTLSDADNFNRAFFLKNTTYCNLILNTTLKNECFKIKAKNNTIVSREPQIEKNIEDIDNFNRAIILKDKTYCEKIIDEQTKTNCLNRTFGKSTTLNTSEQTTTDQTSIQQESSIQQELSNEIDIEDINNFNRAIMLEDKTYCEKIIDEQTKTNCLSR
jgi:hypothetical protein